MTLSAERERRTENVFHMLLKYCSFLDFEFIEKCYESFVYSSSGRGGGAELSTELMELPTKNSANFCNFKNPVYLRVMIFAELYLRRTLELFFN